MPTLKLFRMDLRRLILLLALGSALLTLVNSFHASYQVQKDLVVSSALEANRVYASKLASSINTFFKTAQQQLAYSATMLGQRFTDPLSVQEEVQRLRLQTDSFNSVFIVDAQGAVKVSFPDGTLSKALLADQEALEHRVRTPHITKPYVDELGQSLLVSIVCPVVAPDGRYLGYVGGSVHLGRQNTLSLLVGEHYYRDGSYLYLVDQEKRLIYHFDPERLGEVVQGNPAIDAVVAGKAGSLRLSNSRGVEMLAGYAPVPSVGWGVVAQRPISSAFTEVDGLMLAIFRHLLPWAVAGLIGIYFFARLIALPLWQLAKGVRHMDADNAADQIRQVSSWYFEAAELKRAILAGLGSLHQRIGTLNRDVLTDPLTGLYNRRGLSVTLDAWQARCQSFAVIALDIDHFKNVNDLYGHDIGDQVIKHLAQLMRESSRVGDVLCRNGGEEFLILLPGADVENAKQVAERLRLRMQLAEIMGVDRPVTISLGVSQWLAAGEETVSAVLKIADRALYTAKHQGRNQVVVGSHAAS